MGKGQRSKKAAASVLGGQTMAAKKQEKGKKAKKIIIIVAVVLAFAALIGLTLYNKNEDEGIFWRNKTVMKTDHYKVTNGMLAYYFRETYMNTYNNYISTFGESMMQYIGLDTSKALKDQPYTMGGEDSEYETWYDYFMAQARTVASQYLSLSEAAREAGVKLTDDDKKVIDGQLDTYKEYAKTNGVTLDSYLRNVFGKSVTKSNLKKALELETLARRYASHFRDGVDVSEEKIEEVYSSDPLTYENVSYLMYQFKSSDLMPKDDDTSAGGADTDAATPADTGAETGSPDTVASADSEESKDTAPAETGDATEPVETKNVADTEPADTDVKTTGDTEPADTGAETTGDAESEEDAAAKEAAIAAVKKYSDDLAAVKSEDEFKEFVKNYAMDVLGQDEETAAGTVDGTLVDSVSYNEENEAIKWAYEAKVGETKVVASETGETVTVYYLVKEHYRDDEATRDVRHILFSKDDENAEKVAQTVYDSWVEDGANLDEFIKLANDKSTDPGSNTNGGLYEGVKRGQMVDEFNDWLFDPARKEGDHGLIETSYGWHIMYYVGENDPAWKNTIRDKLRSDAFEEESKRAEETYKVTVNEKAIRVDDYQR